MSSSVTNPTSLFFSKTGSCLTPLSIINLAALLRETSGSNLGAGLIKVLTFVVAGSSLDLFIHRLAITPEYLPFSFITARTGGISFLNKSKHLESASFSLTDEKPFDKTSFTEIGFTITFSSSLVMDKVEFKNLARCHVGVLWALRAFCFFFYA